MVGTPLKWVLKVAVVGATVAVLFRILRSMSGSRSTGGQFLPPVGSDTWPPVPTNPGRSC
jgi:hypothetical protein